MLSDFEMKGGENGAVVLVRANTQAAVLFLLKYAAPLAQETRDQGATAVYMLAADRAKVLYETARANAFIADGSFVQELKKQPAEEQKAKKTIRPPEHMADSSRVAELSTAEPESADLKVCRTEDSVIVCGLSDKGLRFLHEIKARDFAIRVISGKPNVYVLRADILAAARDAGLLILEVKSRSILDFTAARNLEADEATSGAPPPLERRRGEL